MVTFFFPLSANNFRATSINSYFVLDVFSGIKLSLKQKYYFSASFLKLIIK